MEIKILKDTQNPLLERREVEFQVIHAGKPTPEKHGVAEKLSAKLNAKLDLMIIENYTTSFGMNISEGKCHVYANEAAMIRAEPTKLMTPKKRIGFVEKKKEEAPEEAVPTPEAPKEAAQPPKEEKPKAVEAPKEQAPEEPSPKEAKSPKEEAKPKEEKKDETQSKQEK